MKRLQRFLGRAVDLEAARDADLLGRLGIEARYLPEALEDFDEMELGLGLVGDRTVIFTLVLEKGRLGRISLGYVLDPQDDDMRAFSESELAAVMDERGEALLAFVAAVTKSG